MTFGIYLPNAATWVGGPRFADRNLWSIAMETEPLALRPRAAAKALGISVRTLWNLTAPRGPIRAVKAGAGKRAAVLYPMANLTAFVNGRAHAGAAR